MKFLKQINTLFYTLSVVAGVCVFTFTTFATVRYVDDKHADSIKHTDSNALLNRQILLEMRDKLNVIDMRTWEMQRDRSSKKF